MTKQELIKICEDYAERGARSAISVLDDFRSYPKNMQTKDRLCRLIIHSRYLLRNNMFLLDELDRQFSKMVYSECVDYICLDGRVKNGKE